MQNKESGTVYGGFFVRLAAFIVDSLIVGTGLLLIRVPIWFASLGTENIFARDFIFQYSVLDIFYYVLKLCYFVLLTYYTGATLGKKLFHLKVTSSEDRKPTLFEIIFRESVGRFLSHLIFCVGYIMVGADKKKRGLHDILSDTYVVYEHKVSVAVPTPVYMQRIPYAVQPGQNQFMPGNVVQNSMHQPLGQNQSMPGNTAQNLMHQPPGQSQSMPGNTAQNLMHQPPGQNQSMPGNTAQNSMHQPQGQSQFISGNTAQNSMHQPQGQSQFMSGNIAQNPMSQPQGQNQFMPGNAVQNPMPHSPVQSQNVTGNVLQENQEGQQLDNDIESDVSE